MHAWHTQRLKEDIRSPGARVASAFEAPCGRWELSLSPLQGQKVLLTRESSLQPLHFIFFFETGPFAELGAHQFSDELASDCQRSS